MRTSEEHFREMRARDRWICPICGRRMSKMEYWDVGCIRTKWMGDDRYDNERGVFVHNGDIHPCIEERWVCQDCFEAVMAAIRGRRGLRMTKAGPPSAETMARCGGCMFFDMMHFPNVFCTRHATPADGEPCERFIRKNATCRDCSHLRGFMADEPEGARYECAENEMGTRLTSFCVRFRERRYADE